MVLDLIRSSHPISRAQIAKDLELSKATVSSIVEELLSKKLLITVGSGSSTREGGRRGSLLAFNSKSAFGIGLDISGSTMLCILSDMDGEILYQEETPTSNRLEEIIAFIRRTIQHAHITEENILALGMGIPGSANIKKGIVVGAPLLNWTHYPLKELLEPHFPFPVFINNDVNCAALGERWLGSGERSDNLFFVAIGTGVGSAIVSDGNLIYGHNYEAGEIALQTSVEDTRNNRFNSLYEFGVFEKKVSGTALAQHGYSEREIFLEYAKGNENIVPIIRDFILNLSVVIANVVSLLNPEKVVLGGVISEYMTGILFEIQRNVDRLTPMKVKIELASLGRIAGALGAVSYAFKEIEETNFEPSSHWIAAAPVQDE